MLLSKPHKRFAGYWQHRLDGLFTCGVDYAGKSILDVGCNMGVVAYEIAKCNPASIHGIDRHLPHILVARTIFSAVPIDSRFDCATLGGRFSRARLKPEYDVVLLLAVYLHIRRKKGPDRAQRAARDIASRCRSHIVLADVGESMAEFIDVVAKEGFAPASKTLDRDKGGHLVVLSRQ